MVIRLSILSATGFLESLYQLYRNDWKIYTDKNETNDISIPKNENGNYDERSQMIAAISFFGGNSTPKEQQISKSHYMKLNFTRQSRIKSKMNEDDKQLIISFSMKNNSRYGYVDTDMFY